MADLQSAISHSIEGPLHRAVEELEDILRANPREKAAAAYLADVYRRLCRYEDALAVLDHLKQNGRWDGDLQAQRDSLTRVLHDLNTVEKIRFRDGMFISHAIVPDGRGGYYADSFGFPGTWTVRMPEKLGINPGGYLRLLKSLARVTSDIRHGRIRPSRGLAGPKFEFNGDVEIAQGLDPPVCIGVIKHEGRLTWRATVSPEFLLRRPQDQQSRMADMLREGIFEVVVAPRTEESTAAPLATGTPRTILISLGLASDYAVAVLRDRLLAEGVPAAASFIRSQKYLDELMSSYAALPGLDSQAPSIFAVSVLDAVIESACNVIALIRRHFPHAFVIVGGSTSQTPEQFTSLVPDFDILIRGDGDEILPRVAKVIGARGRTEGLTDSQIAALKRLPGGLIVQQGDLAIVHRIDVTNVPEEYHLPRVDKKKTIYYWQTSRGCPYDCRFCYKWTGKRYHMVVPWDGDCVNLSPAERSAQAMKEFLLSRLAMEYPERISLKDMEDLLIKARVAGKPLTFPDLREKVFIVIEDDDFLLNRERIWVFSRMVNDLGLQAYFIFSAITSVRTLYRGGSQPDREVLEWLKLSGFRSLDLGSDGLCQETIDENQKGYSLDRHVIPLNGLLREMGFFAFNNTIISTPYTTVPQFIESLIFYILCTYPINIAIEIGIMAHIGSRYTNEDIVIQEYDWSSSEEKSQLHYEKIDNYLIPKNFPEYALAGSQIISYADPQVYELVLKFPHQGPLRLLTHEIPAEEVDAVVASWLQLPNSRSETRAIGRCIDVIRRRKVPQGLDAVLLTIKEEMSVLDLWSFERYYEKLAQGEVQTDPRFQLASAKIREAAQHKKLGQDDAAEEALKLLVDNIPWYYRPYQELIMLLLSRGKISEAVASFSQYQLIHPDLLFYFAFFNELAKSLSIEGLMAADRAVFHIPRYYTISPIYYYLAVLKELAGNGRVSAFSFGKYSPQDVEKLYDLFDFLTVDTIRTVVRESATDVQSELISGRELSFMGIPVRLESNNRILAFDLRRIRVDAALTIGHEPVA